MEDEWRDGVTEDIVEEGAADENGETGGGLKSRSRKNRLFEKEGEIKGDAGVDGQVVGEHVRSVYLDQEQGIKSSDETNSTGLEEVDQLVTGTSMQNHETYCLSELAENFLAVGNHHHCKDLKVENQPTAEEECGSILTGKEEQVTLLDESKPVIEMDLERILEEQDTHDLYCPNCHSCITKRVILRKRKRTSKENISDAKHVKIEPVQADLIADTSAAATTGESHDTEPDVFRCLSCLSFFIPTGTGFRLFKRFGKKGENENVQSLQQMPGRNQTWMFSLFELMKCKNKGGGLESGILKHDKKDETKLPSTLPLLGNKMSYEKKDTASPEIGVQTPANLGEIIEENVKDANVEHLDDKENSQISLRPEPKPLNEAHMNTGEKMANETRNEIARGVPHKGNEVNTVSFLNLPWQSEKHLPDKIKNAAMFSEQLPKNISGSIGRQVEHVEKDFVKYIQIPPNQEAFLSEQKKIEKAEKLHVSKEGNEGKGIISVPEGMTKTIQEIYLEEPSQHDLSLTTPVAPALPIHGETRIHLGERTMGEARLTHQWDVLKAIVYGGLLESIASLGVISSAAGSNVTSLNVIALGLANLVGGLLVMIHNLVELKNEQYKGIDKKEEADHYWELLGRRGYFWLHATVALISYILVGILPPIIYGFSFRKSDNKEYKLIVVAGASLLCIALLAIGKAHVQEGRKPYVKTLLYYIGLGVGASGLSYAVGILIKQLLEKHGLFDDNLVVPMPPFSSILEVTARTPSWQSY